jgi:hypothetical protein
MTEALTGTPLAAPWLLPLLAVFATAVALWRIGIAWFGDARAGLVAALIYPAYSLALEGAIHTSELLTTPFVAFGLLMAGRAGLGAAFAAGLLFGLAGAIKQVAIFEAMLGFVILLGANRRAATVALFGLGAALPLACFGAWFAAIGQFDAFLQASVLSAARRTAGDGVTFAEGLLRFLPMLRPLLPLVVLACFAWTERAWFRARRPPAHYARLGGWLVASGSAVLLLRAMYAHYFLMLLPPLVLAASLFLAELTRRADGLRGRAGAAATVAAVWLFAPAWVSVKGEWPSGDRGVAAIIGTLREHGLEPGSRDLFVVDHELSMHLLTGTVQPTRFAFPQHLVCDFPLPPGVTAEQEIERVMAARPRFVVVTAGRTRFVCTRPERMALIARHLDAAYRRIATIETGWLPVEVWRRAGP